MTVYGLGSPSSNGHIPFYIFPKIYVLFVILYQIYGLKEPLLLLTVLFLTKTETKGLK